MHYVYVLTNLFPHVHVYCNRLQAWRCCAHRNLGRFCGGCCPAGEHIACLYLVICINHHATATVDLKRKTFSATEFLYKLQCIARLQDVGRPHSWTPPLSRQAVSTTLQPHNSLVPALLPHSGDWKCVGRRNVLLLKAVLGRGCGEQSVAGNLAFKAEQVTFFTQCTSPRPLNIINHHSLFLNSGVSLSHRLRDSIVGKITPVSQGKQFPKNQPGHPLGPLKLCNTVLNLHAKLWGKSWRKAAAGGEWKEISHFPTAIFHCFAI